MAIVDPTDESPTRTVPSPRHSWLGRLHWALPWLLVGGAYAAIAFAYLLPRDLRNDDPVYILSAWSAFMVRTFLFHAGLVLVWIAVRAAFARRWRLLAATVPLLAFTLGPAVWSYVPKRSPPVVGQTLRVLSANLLYLNRDTDQMREEILAADADLVLLQEYTPHWHDALEPALAAEYPHQRTMPQPGCFGMAIYSRRPFAGPVRNLPCGEYELLQMRATVDVDGQTIAVYNIHLAPPKDRRAFSEQCRGLADLLEHLDREPGPVLLTGDFNFTDRSSLAATLHERGFRDAHDISGTGRGVTWFKNPLGIRIDHFYVSPHLTSPVSRVGTGPGSDHRPVIAEIGFLADGGE